MLLAAACFYMQHFRILEKTTANDIVRSRCQLKPPTRSVVVYCNKKAALRRLGMIAMVATVGIEPTTLGL